MKKFILFLLVFLNACASPDYIKLVSVEKSEKTLPRLVFKEDSFKNLEKEKSVSVNQIKNFHMYITEKLLRSLFIRYIENRISTPYGKIYGFIDVNYIFSLPKFSSSNLIVEYYIYDIDNIILKKYTTKDKLLYSNRDYLLKIFRKSLDKFYKYVQDDFDYLDNELKNRAKNK